jgi:hypothetical protein
MRQPSGWLLAIAVALFVGAVVAWVISGPHKTVVHDRPRLGPTTVLVAPPQTPLPRDSGPKNNARAKQSGQAKKVGSVTGHAKFQARKLAKPQKRRVPVKTRKTPRSKAKRPAVPQRPTQPSQPANPAPAPDDPTVTATVPLPVGVCIRDVARLNHC